MNTPQTNTQTQVVDSVAQDMKAAIFVVSLVGNLAFFVTWLAYSVV